MTKPPNKYKIENQRWTKIDQKKNCTETPVLCKICGNYGHFDIYLNSKKQTKNEIGADIVCKHAHFVIDVDRGRNVWCVIERVMIPKSKLKVTYTIHDRKGLPQWIKDKLDGRDF